jgi:hypothetical protein
MTRRRPPHIPQRRPVYIGCEGASEAGYAQFLQDLLRAANQPVHLIVQDLGPGAGDPLARIEMAVRRLTRLKSNREAPNDRFVLLDDDQAQRHRQRAETAKQLARDNGIIIVWQRPCFEAVLLRHLDGRAAHRPPDTLGAEQALVRDWPDYSKPMNRLELARRLDRAAVRRAAAVEPELNTLLKCIGL